MGTRAVIGLLVVIVPLSSGLSGCLTYQFVHFISRIKRGQYIAGLMASLTLLLDLLSMVFQIILFKTFTQKAIIDEGPVEIPSWQVISLITVNFLISTMSRLFFTRLASTMLRRPRVFLFASLFLFSATIVGTIIEGTYTGSGDQTDGTKDPARRRYALHLIYGLGAVLWDWLICGVLLYNLLDSNRRCRFGSIDGKASFGVALLFESLLAATILVTGVFVALLTLMFHSQMSRLEEMEANYTALVTLITRVYGISILCSLQHKMYEHSKLALGQKLFSNTTPITNVDSNAGQDRSSPCPDPDRSPEAESGRRLSVHLSRNLDLEAGESGEGGCVDTAKTILSEESVVSLIHVLSSGNIVSRHGNGEVVISTEKPKCEVSGGV